MSNLFVSILIALFSINIFAAFVSSVGFGMLYWLIIIKSRQRLNYNSQCIAEESTKVVQLLQEGKYKEGYEILIEFANQGPLLELKKGRCRFAITGNVAFNIISKNLITHGIPNRTYLLYEGDKLDILTTIKSNYGYFTVEGGFNLQKEYGCFSTLTQSKIGANEGNKICCNI